MFDVDKLNIDHFIQHVEALHSAYGSSPQGSDANSDRRQPRLFPQYVYRCHIGQRSDDMVAHTWVIHLQRDGLFQVYQSNIGKYTLQTDLQRRGPMNHTQMLAYLDNIKQLTSATAWSAQLDALYDANFGASLTRLDDKLGSFSKSKGWLGKLVSRGAASAAEGAQGHVDYITFKYGTVCDLSKPLSRDQTRAHKRLFDRYTQQAGDLTFT